ncbi:MAG: hypothetical protein Ta2A_01220 [Treponemataceae bacterium]|nr:MAG: hypothetical protein Ta2A_01220 [Treponemataceae bacterium]
MKHLFSKKSQTARRVWTRIGAIVAITVAVFSCKFAGSIPEAVKKGGDVNSNLKLVNLSYAVGDSYEDAEAFEKAPESMVYTLTVTADDLTVWIYPELNVPGSAFKYDVLDRTDSVKSAKIETTGKISLDVANKSKISLYLYIGKKQYTIMITKNEPEGVVYVSPAGDGSGNDNDDNGQRGLTPGSAFYSLTKAIEKAMGPAEYNHVVVLGVLTQDRDLDGMSNDHSSVFRITSSGDRTLVISGGMYGQYQNVEPGLSAEGAANAADGNRAKRVLSISGGAFVELRGLTISGSGKKNATEMYNSFADKGAGILVSGAETYVRLRSVEVTGNTAQDSGGGIYIDGAKVELGNSACVYENNVEHGASSGTSVYYDSGSLTFSGNGAALRVDTSTSAINDAVLGRIPDTVYVADNKTITVADSARPLIESSTYYGLAAYIVVSTEKYANGTQVLQGAGITNDKADKRFMRFRSFGGAQLWAIDEGGKLASSTSYYVGATGGNDYYDGLSPDTAFNSLECALAYANAAENQGSFINRKLTVLSELTAANHTNLRYPGVLSGAVVTLNGDSTLFDITFDGMAQNRDGSWEDASNLLCLNDIVITALEGTLKFACNFTDATLTFANITLYRSAYRRSLVYGATTYGEGDVVSGVVTATDVAFSDDVQAGGSFTGTVIIDAAPDKPVVFKRALSDNSIRFFAGAACAVTVNAGQLNFMGTAEQLTITGGLVTDEYNSSTVESTADSVQLTGGRLVIKQVFVALIDKYPGGSLSFEGGYIPDGSGDYGIVLHDGAGAIANPKGIETHDPEPYFAGTTSGQNHIARIYLDRGVVSQLRGYKAFDFTNLANGTDAVALSEANKTIADVAALYPLETEHTQYVWQIGADSANTRSLGLIGRPFILGDVINHEKTYYKDPNRFDDKWNPLPSELVERTSVVYKLDGGTVWKALYWGLLNDDHNPSNHDSDEGNDHTNWFGTTGNAERKDGYGKIPGGTAHYGGHWQIPKETDDGFGKAGEGSNNIRNNEWAIIKTELGIQEIAANNKLKNGKEGFWTEASMGTAFGYGTFVSTGAVIGLIALAIVFFATGVLTGPGVTISVGWLLAYLGLFAGTGGAIGTLISVFLNGQSVLEMVYKPSEDDYELADKDEQSFPTVVIQRFDNYVCYDPDPVHAQ